MWKLFAQTLETEHAYTLLVLIRSRFTIFLDVLANIEQVCFERRFVPERPKSSANC